MVFSNALVRWSSLFSVSFSRPLDPARTLYEEERLRSVDAPTLHAVQAPKVSLRTAQENQRLEFLSLAPCVLSRPNGGGSERTKARHSPA